MLFRSIADGDDDGHRTQLVVLLDRMVVPFRYPSQQQGVAEQHVDDGASGGQKRGEAKNLDR